MTYATISATIERVTWKTAWLKIKGRVTPIARGMIYGPHDLRLERMPRDREVSLKIIDWKASELGL